MVSVGFVIQFQMQQIEATAQVFKKKKKSYLEILTCWLGFSKYSVSTSSRRKWWVTEVRDSLLQETEHPSVSQTCFHGSFVALQHLGCFYWTVIERLWRLRKVPDEWKMLHPSSRRGKRTISGELEGQKDIPLVFGKIMELWKQ